METVTRPTPYVGVSGVMSAEQQQFIEATAEQAELFLARMLLVAVKAPPKTFDPNGNTKDPEHYPADTEAFHRALTVGRPAVLRAAQTWMRGGLQGDLDELEVQVDQIVRAGSPWLNALQFDQLPFHTKPSVVDFLARIRTKYGLPIILQCHKSSMEALRPDNMAAALAKLAIDYALFDASHGDGKELDAAYLSPYLEACFASPELANVSFGVAGGLRGDRVLQHLPAVLENYPIGWDAEAQLRSVRPDSSRPLDLMRVAEYIHASAEVTSCYNR